MRLANYLANDNGQYRIQTILHSGARVDWKAALRLLSDVCGAWRLPHHDCQLWREAATLHQVNDGPI
jgi:hypothetical protein